MGPKRLGWGPHLFVRI